MRYRVFIIGLVAALAVVCSVWVIGCPPAIACVRPASMTFAAVAIGIALLAVPPVVLVLARVQPPSGGRSSGELK